MSLAKLQTGEDGRLQAFADGEWKPVQVHRCFPWTEPEHFISLRDTDGKEVALVDDPASLDEASRAAVQKALAMAAFVFEITSIDDIRQDIELRVWSVKTDKGARRFQTELDAWPDSVPGGGWLLRDVTGDLYRFPPIEKMDRATRKKFWAFQD